MTIMMIGLAYFEYFLQFFFFLFYHTFQILDTPVIKLMFLKNIIVLRKELAQKQLNHPEQVTSLPNNKILRLVKIEGIFRQPYNCNLKLTYNLFCHQHFFPFPTMFSMGFFLKVITPLPHNSDA